MKGKIKHEALKYPTISVQALADMVQSSSGVCVSERTIKNALHSDGLHGRAPKKKPFINERNRKKRLAFARENPSVLGKM
uniref:HTH_Tnp_Tc3_2 domain-containing protein n=1 Tax=Rhodnius prolixus TaxID=13249 RepID=T1HBX2_RHOPR